MVDLSFNNYVREMKANTGTPDDFSTYRHQKQQDAPSGDYVYRPDQDALRTLQRLKPLNLTISALVRFWKESWRGELLGHAVKVTPRQFSNLYQIGMECAEELHLVLPPMYVIQNPYLNAMTLGLEDDSIIIIHSATVDHLSREELKSVIGHECGHIANGHVLYHTVAQFLASGAAMLIAWLAQPLRMMLLDWIRKSEITADRAGLICAQDETIATRTLVKLALGSQNLYEQVNVDEYLKQLDELRGTIGKFAELTQTHPFLPKRVKALQLFAKSKYYQQRVLGMESTGGMSMTKLDEHVAKIIAI
ncbi:MAG: M48 family peptidase [Gemmatimonadetes bacterium]|nr:MAG: M48 family peptidase [Gemmatimonadota bacterium]